MQALNEQMAGEISKLDRVNDKLKAKLAAEIADLQQKLMQAEDEVCASQAHTIEPAMSHINSQHRLSNEFSQTSNIPKGLISLTSKVEWEYNIH